MVMRRYALALAATVAVSACSDAGGQTASVVPGSANAAPAPATPLDTAFSVTELADLDNPWAIAVLPGTAGVLVTEQDGRLLWLRSDGTTASVAGVPRVAYAGQGGLGDVVLHPGFASNRMVYLSWVEAGDGGTKGAVVGRARLGGDDRAPRLEGLEIVWRQGPKVTGNGHFGHRIAFGPDAMLYIASGERQKFTPAQDRAQNLGKIVRLTDAGAVPEGNAIAGASGVEAQIWSLGHRNPLGIAFDSDGRLWEIEMGPRGGDELNLIERGGNYGYPTVSNGDHYDGRVIPDHSAGDGFVAPKLWWTPAISPAGLLIYSGGMFPAWRGDAFIPALSGEALVRVDLDGTNATPAQRWSTGFRVRAVAEAGDGALLIAEDGDSGGRILRLTRR